jgi:hypothetical protein
MFLFFGIWWFAVWFPLFDLFILYSCVSLAQRLNMQWLCCKCDSINISSFTYHTYELGNHTSYYEPLTTPASFTESFTSKFSPLETSSPKSLKANDTQEYSRYMVPYVATVTTYPILFPCSHIPQGKILLCLGPGFSSI